MLTTFRAQIAAGGPVTVTHPEVARYFMTVEEAVELVIQAGAVGSGGEVLVLDMGEPVKIAEVATRMAAAAQCQIEIVYTGLRPGEKLDEQLFADDEVDARPIHPLIAHVGVAPLPPAVLEVLDLSPSPDGLVEVLAELCRVPAVRATEVGAMIIDLTDRAGDAIAM